MRCTVVAATALSLFVASHAEAHVRITSPTPRTSVDLKDRHCGVTGSARANVQTYRPGAVVHLVLDEYIPHPGWMRVSWNPNGDTFRIPPGDAAGVPAGYPTENLTGMLDPGGSGSTIIADRIPTGTTTFDVTLPTTETTNGTIQVIQMMTDKAPYTIDAASNDIYFACVDVIISASAPIVDAGPGSDGGTSGNADAGDSPSEVSGGCTTSSSGSAGLAALLGLALIAPLRRRRR